MATIYPFPGSPLIIEPPVVPHVQDLSSSSSRASSRSRSASPSSRSARLNASSPVYPPHSPLLSPPPVVPPSPHPSQDFSSQPVFGMSSTSSSRTATPEIFIPPPLGQENTNPPTTDPVPVQELPAAAPIPWARAFDHLSYPQFNYYPPQPYSYPNPYTPYIPQGPDLWPPPLLSTPYLTPQFPPPGYGYPTPFNISTAHNMPFPQTPIAMGPPTPWVPTTPWVAGSPAVRINPRLAPGQLRWDLLHPPDHARYINDWGALKAPKFSDDGLTMAPPTSGTPVKVTQIQISSSPHPVLSYWMSIWGPIPLPHHKVFDILSAIYNYFCLPLTAQETRLLLETPQNISYARRTKESRARDGMALECVVLGEEGYRRIDVIGIHRGFGGISIDKITPVLAAPPFEGDNLAEQESQVEVELSMVIGQVPNATDENLF